MNESENVLYFSAVTPKHYLFEPQPDITAYELSLMLPVFFAAHNIYADAAAIVDKLPPEAKRHFRWIAGTAAS